MMKSKKCDILLIPPVINSHSVLNFQDDIPVGLLALAAGIKKSGFHPMIYTPHKKLYNTKDYEDIAREIIDLHPGMIGFSTWCINYPSSILIAKNIKLIKPEIPIIFGGPQASLLSRETLKEFDFVDFVLGGECDFTLPELIRTLSCSYRESSLFSIPGLTFRTTVGEIIQNKPGYVIKDLNLLPVPLFNLSKPGKRHMLDVGRGCPFQCTFCSTSDFFSKDYRTKKPERIIMEMDLVFRKYGIRHFSFSHDMFTLNRPFIQDFCFKMIAHSKTLKKSYFWDCSVRCDCVSEDLLKLMKEAGCQAIFIGVESGSEKIQQSIRKNIPVEDVFRITGICRSLGMEVNTAFMMGFPDETEEDLEKTLQCIARLSFQGFHTQISELSLLPGTPLYLQTKDSLKFDGRFSNFSNCLCSIDELKLIIKYPGIFSSFYYLPVRPIDRYSQFLLQDFINCLLMFRNSLFLLQHFLQKDLEGVNLLHLAKKHSEALKEKTNAGIPVISIVIDLIRQYILSSSVQNNIPYILDIFRFEAIKALMLFKLSTWLLIQPERESKPERITEVAKKFSITPVPHWKTITTGFALRSVLPSDNKWSTENIKAVKGKFHYLIMAVTEIKCNVYKITPKEKNWLDHLDYDFVTEKGGDFGRIFQETGTEAFQMKMIKRRMVRISNTDT